MTVDSAAGCVFCAIVAGDAPAHEVLRTDDVVAFLDVKPVFGGHVLVVPVTHVDTLPDLPRSALPAYMEQVQRLARTVPIALGAQGTWVSINNIVSQSVPHLHTHVIPRTKGDGLRGFFWPRRRYADGEAEQTATQIRTALQAP